MRVIQSVVTVAFFLLISLNIFGQSTVKLGAGIKTPWKNTAALSTNGGLTISKGLGIEYLIVGGGGGGGNGWHAGGGGAGGMLTGSTVIAVGKFC